MQLQIFENLGRRQVEEFVCNNTNPNNKTAK